MSAENTKVDAATGISTTGHEWDGIRELNTPLPRWWLWLFYACIAWGIVWVILYPAIPLVSGYTRGLLGYSSREQLDRDMAALQAQRGQIVAQLESASLEDIEKNPAMLNVSQKLGKVTFATNCAPCHGQGGNGGVGYPNLRDDQWLWGGSLDQIYQTIQYGIRNGSDEARLGNMPAFGKDGIIPKADIPAVAAYVRTLSGNKPEGNADLAKGQKLFAENCAACHGDEGKGNPDLGAPNLTSKGAWLYGDDEKSIIETITNGRGGVMPGWAGRLDPATIKALAVYVHSGFGGQ